MSQVGVSGRPPEEADDEDGTQIGLSRLVGALGVVVIGIGIAAVAVPGLGAGVAIEYTAVIVIGFVLLLLGLVRWLERLSSSVEAATPPAVEERTTVSVPGGAFDQALRATPGNPMERVQRQDAMRDRLRPVARDVLGRHAGRDPETVDEQLDRGTWTDDPQAAALFTGDSPGTLRERLGSLVGSGSDFAGQVTRALAELARHADSDPTGWESDDGETDAEPTTAVGERATGRWQGLTALALTLVGLGAVLGRPALVLGGAVLSGFGAVVAASASPTADLRVTRRIEASEPRPGASVRVCVDIENVGDELAADLRVVDGVPDGLTVEDGSPRHGTALRPGASTTYTYTVRAVRGTHTFERPTLLTRNLSGTIERVSTVETEGDGTISYDVSSAMEQSVPLRKQASQHVGRVQTDVGGSGIEFHSVREYRTGDSLTRIDWNRAARGEGLATLQFREERSATVVIVIDARADAYVAPADDAPSALDRSVLAAAQLVSALLEADDRVGLASLSPRRCWLAPGAGQTHRARAHEMLATHEAFAPDPPSSAYVTSIRLAALRKRLPGDAQLLVFSPVSDEQSVGLVRQLQASGHPVTLLSPDATAQGTPGETLAHFERSMRLSRLRRADVRVVDWADGEPLGVALTQAARRWSG